MSKLVILGNGSMAQVLYSYLKDRYQICGFCVDKKCIKDKFIFNKPVVAIEKIEEYFSCNEYKIANSIGYVEMNDIRKSRYINLKEKGFKFISYIHPSVKIHENVKIEDGCIILDFVSIHPNTTIKEGTFISSNVSIGHDSCIGEFNWINSGVSIAGFVNTGKNCFWGINSCCGNNINIGNYNYIGANTLVNKNTNDNEVFISASGEKFKLSSKKFLSFIGG